VPILTQVELRGRGRLVLGIILAVLIVGIPMQVFPYAWMLSNSLKKSIDIFRFPPTLLPSPAFWDNFRETFVRYRLGRNLLNSFILCFGTIGLQVSVSSLAGFSLSKLKPAGSRYVLLFFLGTLMINNQALMIPTYIMMYNLPLLHLNLINSFWSVLLPFSAWGFAIFMFKGFFDSLPQELIEAARIDGCSNMGIFLRIVIPLSRPVFAVIILNTFVAVYNQFMFPLLLLPNEKKWTLMIRIYAASEGSVSWNHVMVMLTIATLPVIAMYVLAQKYIVQGVSLTGIKG
jgi:multiple sugar transport system permease protein